MERALETKKRTSDGVTDKFQWTVKFARDNGLIRLEVITSQIQEIVIHTCPTGNTMRVYCEAPYSKHTEKGLPFFHDGHYGLDVNKTLCVGGGNRLCVEFSNYPKVGPVVHIYVPHGFELEVNAPTVGTIRYEATHPTDLYVKKAAWTTYPGYSGYSERGSVSWMYREFGAMYKGHPATTINAPEARVHLPGGTTEINDGVAFARY